MSRNFVLSILIIICLPLSCKFSNTKDSKIFEPFLDKEKISVIDYSIHLLDSLVIKYSGTNDLDSAYTYFLTSLFENTIDTNSFRVNNNIIKEINHRIKKSGLFYELTEDLQYKHIRIDSNFIEIENFLDGEFNSILSIGVSKEENIDSVLVHWLNRIEYNPLNPFLEALKTIQNQNKIIEEYIAIKEKSPDLSPYSLAGGFLHSETDYSNYYLRSILALEFVFWYLY